MNFDILKKLNVLYVEDEADILKQTKMILDDFVNVVYTANNGEDALEIVKTQKVDVIITDILMPKLTGIELLKELRQNNNFTPAIITTAFAEVEYLLDAIKLKVDGYILKPINMKELLSSLYAVALPNIQKQEIEYYNSMISTLSILVGGKKIEIIKYIMDNLDEEDIFYGSYSDIIEELGVSKPTVIKVFKQLGEEGILEKIKNKVYKFKKHGFIGEA